MLAQFFTWWNSSTYGTSFTLWRRGAKLVGSDNQGNRYFTETKATGPGGIHRRWVIYHGVADASRVPSEWHGWLHHTFKEPPTSEPFTLQSWEKDHLPNMTGTPLAYHPKGSLEFEKEGVGPDADYEAWTPETS